MRLEEALPTLRAAKPLLGRYGVERIGVFGSVAHGYPELDADVIWTIITTRLEELDAAARRMIAKLEGH